MELSRSVQEFMEINGIASMADINTMRTKEVGHGEYITQISIKDKPGYIDVPMTLRDSEEESYHAASLFAIGEQAAKADGFHNGEFTSQEDMSFKQEILDTNYQGDFGEKEDKKINKDGTINGYEGKVIGYEKPTHTPQGKPIDQSEEE